MAGTRVHDVPRQRSTADRERYDRARDRRDPGGRTDIAAGAIEKTAARAVSEVPGARKAPRGRAVRARVSGDIVLLRLRISVDYPEPVRRIAVLVRSRVRERVEHTTGKRVHHIDIEIAEMVR